MENIKKNKYVLLLLSIVFIILIYCSTQTFIINDDLPYSMYYRGTERITNIKQVILNQMVDYANISGRVFVHIIVQSLLIFNKGLWSILNPLMIVITIALMSYIVKKIIKNKEVNNIYIVMFSTFFYLILYNFKNIIYWVAGSVNYVWIFVLMLLFIIYLLKVELIKKPLVTAFICLGLSLLHECLAIFVIICVLGDLILKFIIDKQTLKENYLKYFIFLCASAIGFSFILFAPSTSIRQDIPGFTELSFLAKILTSIPVISTNLFKVNDIYNLFPIFFIISITCYLFKTKNKYFIYYVLLTCIIIFLGLIIENGYIWFILGVYLFLVQSAIFIKNKDYRLLIILIGAYAISYSLSITPEYTVGRPNYHFFLIISMFIMYNIFNSNFGKKSFNIIKILIILGFIITLLIEIHIYHYIGEIKDERETSIIDAKEKDKKIIELKEMKAPYNKFHMDSNSPANKDYWAYKHFLHYYGLTDDVDTKIVK